jgi:hypothetical protein
MSGIGPNLLVPPGLSDIEGCACRSTGVSTLEIGRGRVRSLDGALSIIVGGPLDVDVTVVGAGGRDAGAEAADAWYAVYVIADSTGVNGPAGLMSTSFTIIGVTMPAGYDKIRRVGAVRNRGGDFVAFRQDQGGGVKWTRYLNLNTDRAVLVGGAAVVNTVIDCSEFVPPGNFVASFQAGQNGTVDVSFSDNSAVLMPLFTVGSGQTFVFESRLTGLRELVYANAGVGGNVDVILIAYQDVLQ